MTQVTEHKFSALRLLKRCIIAIVVMVALVIALLGIATWTLTPERLTRAFNKYASELVNADIRASRIDYTFWSTFPKLHLSVDTIDIVSHNLTGITESQRRALPTAPDSLLSCRHIEGSLYVPALLKGDISLHDVSVDDFNLRMVSVNDTLNNYNIAHEGPSHSIPFITANHLSLNHGGNISYFNLAKRTRASVRVDSISLLRDSTDFSDSRYLLDIAGIVNASSGRLNVLNRFPVALNGNINLRFRPFGLSLDNYHIALGNVQSRVDMNLNMDDGLRINDFTYEIKRFNIGRLMDYLPVSDFPWLAALDADMTIRASAHLTAPYDLKSGELPSLAVNFDMPAGTLRYTTTKGESFTVNHTPLSGRLAFDGHHPERSTLSIPDFGISGDGVDFIANATVTGLTDRPQVNAGLRGTADLTTLSHNIATLEKYRLTGKAGADLALSFVASDISNGVIERFTLKGTADCTGLSLSDIAPDTDIEIGYAAMDIDADASSLNATGIDGSRIGMKIAADDVHLRSGDLRAYVGGISAHSAMHDHGAISYANLSHHIPVDVDLTAAKAMVLSPRDTLLADARDVHLTGAVRVYTGRLIADAFTGKLISGAASVRMGHTRANVSNASLAFDAERLSHPVYAPDYDMPAKWTADSVSLEFVNHSPAFLQVKIPDELRTLMAQWRTDVSLQAESGAFTTTAFPVMTNFSALDLDASFDRVSLHNIEVDALSTRARLAAEVGNIRQFLTSRTPAPLLLDLNVAIDTVQCNELAAAYEHGVVLTKGAAAAKLKPKSLSASPSDTITMMIPRNIIANINARAMMTRYMNLHLYNLNTGVNVADGKANVKNLRIYADFGHAHLDYLYDSSDLQNLGMHVNAGLMDVDLVKFFKNFHTLLLMMPEMSNLTGNLSIQADAGIMAFPNMYANMPSMHAEVDVSGRKLQLHQTPFIRHITELMLLDDSDIHISNFKAHANVHDNLMELDPFHLSLPKYKLEVAGLNNFDGDMFYHVGIEEWPLHIPFGVNIKGDFKHPEIRLGGSEWKDEYGTEIGSEIEEELRFNLISETKYYIREMIHKAAEASHLPATAYSY